MENRIFASKLLVKFSILCEVLPYLGHLPLWKYLLLNLSKSTKIVWRKNENAFREWSKGMKMEIVKYQKPLDEEYLKYLKDHDILLNCKIWIELDSECGNIALFNDFPVDWLSKNKWPLFHDISIPNSVSIAYFVEKIYNLLRLMNEGQEKILINKWEFIWTRGYLLDNITCKTFSTLMGTKYLDNIQMLLVLKDKRPSYYLSMFKLSKFNVSHINISYKNGPFYEFLW